MLALRQQARPGLNQMQPAPGLTHWLLTPPPKRNWWPACPPPHLLASDSFSVHTKQEHSAAMAGADMSANDPPKMSSVMTSSSPLEICTSAGFKV